MTLRELSWMARARQQSEWLRFAAVISSVCGMFSKKPIDPIKIIPAAYRPPKPPRRKLSPDHQKAETQMGLNLLGKFLSR